MDLLSMINECCLYTGETLGSIDAVTKFKTGINYSYKKIAKEKFHLEFEESMALNSNKAIDLTSLSKKIITLKSLTVNDVSVPFNKVGNQVTCPYNQEGDSATLIYTYLPNDLVHDTDTLEIPEGILDTRVLCYFAVYQYFLLNNEDRASDFLDMWNDGYSSIQGNTLDNTYINTVYSM